MSDAEINLHFTYRVTDEGRFQDYLDLVLPLTEAEEPWVLEYSLSRADGVVLHHERYENEDAILKHLEVTAEGQQAWAEATELLDIRFVGTLSKGFQDKNDGPVASWWTPFRSIER